MKRNQLIIGSVLGGLHFLWVSLGIYTILSSSGDALWQLAWIPFSIADYPLTLILDHVLYPIIPDEYINILGGCGVHDFLLPASFHLIAGSLWFFFLPMIISKLTRFFAKENKSRVLIGFLIISPFFCHIVNRAYLLSCTSGINLDKAIIGLYVLIFTAWLLVIFYLVIFKKRIRLLFLVILALIMFSDIKEYWIAYGWHPYTTSKRININSGELSGSLPTNSHQHKSMLKSGGLELVKFDIAMKSNINWLDEHGRAYLHYAAFGGQYETASLLLDNNANVNLKDKDGNTPLHYAVISGNLETAKLLIEKGADISIENNKGETPVIAPKSNNSEIIALFKK